MLTMMIAGAVLAAAPAGQMAPTQAQTESKPAPDPNKKICRRETATGSMMSKSVCHTRAQWSALDAGDNQYRDGFRNQTTNPGLPALSGRQGG